MTWRKGMARETRDGVRAAGREGGRDRTKGGVGGGGGVREGGDSP